MSGGNALGAYHAGAYEALSAAGVAPTRIAGASIGAVVGALIAGNAPEDRIPRLRQFGIGPVLTGLFYLPST